MFAAPLVTNSLPTLTRGRVIPLCSSPELTAMRCATLSATLGREEERRGNEGTLKWLQQCCVTRAEKVGQSRLCKWDGDWWKENNNNERLKNMSWHTRMKVRRDASGLLYPQWNPHQPAPLWVSVWTSCCRSALCLQSACTHSSSPQEWSPGHQRLPVDTQAQRERERQNRKENIRAVTHRETTAPSTG